MDAIDVTGIDPAEVLAALHNHTRPLGMGWLHAVPGDIDAATAREQMHGDRFPDYCLGRPIKAYLKQRGDRTLLMNAGLYDRDAGEGMCARALATVGVKAA